MHRVRQAGQGGDHAQGCASAASPGWHHLMTAYLQSQHPQRESDHDLRSGCRALSSSSKPVSCHASFNCITRLWDLALNFKADIGIHPYIGCLKGSIQIMRRYITPHKQMLPTIGDQMSEDL